MTLKFYKQAATPNRIDKSGFLTEVGTIDNVVVKDTKNLMSPTFIMQYNPTVYNANYLFCSKTSRYYYITSVDAMTGGRLAINAVCVAYYIAKIFILPMYAIPYKRNSSRAAMLD